MQEHCPVIPWVIERSSSSSTFASTRKRRCASGWANGSASSALASPVSYRSPNSAEPQQPLAADVRQCRTGCPHRPDEPRRAIRAERRSDPADRAPPQAIMLSARYSAMLVSSVHSPGWRRNGPLPTISVRADARRARRIRDQRAGSSGGAVEGSPVPLNLLPQQLL